MALTAEEVLYIDSISSHASFFTVGASLTIRNLGEAVKQKLSLRAASHQTSMEAEARAILAASLSEKPTLEIDKEAARLERRKGIEAVAGIWKDEMGGKRTDEIMHELRGDD